MQLSMFSDYSLRVLVHLAGSPDELLSTRKIAEIHDIKFNHLTKVTGWLVAKGYAQSLRGRAGGLKIARPPSEINLGAFLRELESDKPLVACFDKTSGFCRLSPACGLAIALEEAQEAFFKSLEAHTLEGVVQLAPNMTKLLAVLMKTPQPAS
jgi:Rrf2 family nitric oxide-sensitive transcriptional repressor